MTTGVSCPRAGNWGVVYSWYLLSCMLTFAMATWSCKAADKCLTMRSQTLHVQRPTESDLVTCNSCDWFVSYLFFWALLFALPKDRSSYLIRMATASIDVHIRYKTNSDVWMIGVLQFQHLVTACMIRVLWALPGSITSLNWDWITILVHTKSHNAD